MRTILNKFLFVAILLVGCIITISATDVTYTADNTTIFPNPERGFITMLTGHLTDEAPYGVKGQEGELDTHANKDKGSIVLVHYYLDSYRTTSTLPKKILDAFDEDMQVLRQKGMKAIIRFSYVDGTYKKGKTESAQDATLDIAKSHISQYKSHWQANADVIFCFQAGIVGAWGEWYYSDNFGNKQSEMNDSRRQVIDALLDAVPSDRCIQIRTPLFKTGYVGNTKALTESEAYTGTPKARLGHHNDAFLYDYDNMGTYTDTSTQKPYIAKETLYVPIGGETDITDLNLAKQWATYEKTTAEMSRLHWTFIQSGYATQTTNWWRENGTFDELNRKLGYRYQLVSGRYGNEVSQGGKLAVKMQIKNVGYAPLYNARHAYIVLKDASHQLSDVSLPLETDPRKWLPNGVVSIVEEQLSLPNDIPAGTYDLYLYLPDAYESLAADARYAVRFANENIWDATSGMNKLNAQVTVTQSEMPPTPPDDPEEPSDAIVLPATLNKSNVSTYSEDMTWYNGDYFDFGPTDGENLGRWAEWKVELKYPGKYKVSEVMQSVWMDQDTDPWLLGHTWAISLRKNDSPVSTYITEQVWAEGELNYDAKWDLSNVEKGVYSLHIQNGAAWLQPKLKSLTLKYDGEIPTEKEEIRAQNADDKPHKVIEEGVVYIISKNGSKTNLLGQ